MEQKLNTKIILAIAFLAAAVNSATVAVLCAGVLIFVCKDTARAEKSVEAVLLALSYSLVSYALSAVSTCLGLVSIPFLTSGLLMAISAVRSATSLVVFVLGIIAALNAMNNVEYTVPFVHSIHRDFSKLYVDDSAPAAPVAQPALEESTEA